MDNSKIKILIVDDEADILEFVQYNLQKEGFNVLVANNGIKALEMANREHPNLIILDIMMPEMDGVEVCRQIRSNSRFDGTVIAFLTARNEDYSQIAALDEGGDDFINKPIRPRVLLSRIKALLRRSGKLANNPDVGVMNIGGFTIDKEKVRVVKDGKKIDLPKKEFELLTLLMSKPGKVFSREEIFHKIWGSGVIVGNRTIDVHIRKIREKIGKGFIKTVKGIGYKFEF